ncbi:MAG: CoA transferase, partial [Phreatobacter sp.]
GLAACTGLMAALRMGGAETVDVSLFDVSAWLNWKVAARVTLLGEAGTPGPSDWFTIQAKDGHVALVYQDKDWPALRAMVDDPRLSGAAFATAGGRRAHRDRLVAVLGPWFAARSRAEISAEAEARRLPIGAVRSPLELLTDRQNRARGFLAADGTPLMPLRSDGQRPVRELGHAA